VRIAHVSDLHFGSEIPPVVAALRSRLRELAADLIVVSGDFTMAGRHREYREAARFLADLPAPVLATPGNHDIPVYALCERFARPLRRYERYIGRVTEGRYASGAAALIAINSARPWDFSFDWSRGRVSDEQIAEVARFFQRHGDAAFKAVVVHHPFTVPEGLPGFRTIGNGERMLEMMARCRVDAVLTGHLHQQSATVRRMPLPGETSHDIALIQVATATSKRHRDQPNAFAVIDTAGERAVLSTEVWNGEAFETKGGSTAPLLPRAEPAASLHNA